MYTQDTQCTTGLSCDRMTEENTRDDYSKMCKSTHYAILVQDKAT